MKVSELLQRASSKELQTQLDAVGRIFDALKDLLGPDDHRGRREVLEAVTKLLGSSSVACCSRACVCIVAAARAGALPAQDASSMVLAVLESTKSQIPANSRSLTRAYLTLQTMRDCGPTPDPLSGTALLEIDDAVLWPHVVDETAQLLLCGATRAAGSDVLEWQMVILSRFVSPLAATVALCPRHAGLIPFLAHSLWSVTSSSVGSGSMDVRVRAALLAMQCTILRLASARQAPHAAALALWLRSVADTALLHPAAEIRALVAATAIAVHRNLSARGMPSSTVLAALSLPPFASTLGPARADLAVAVLHAEECEAQLQLLAVLEVETFASTSEPVVLSRQPRPWTAQAWNSEACHFPLLAMLNAADARTKALLQTLMERTNPSFPTAGAVSPSGFNAAAARLLPVCLACEALSNASETEAALGERIHRVTALFNLNSATAAGGAPKAAATLPADAEAALTALSPLLFLRNSAPSPAKQCKTQATRSAVLNAAAAFVAARPSAVVLVLPLLLEFLGAHNVKEGELRGGSDTKNLGAEKRWLVEIAHSLPALGRDKIGSQLVGRVIDMLALPPPPLGPGEVPPPPPLVDRSVGIYCAGQLALVNLSRSFSRFVGIVEATTPNGLLREEEPVRLAKAKAVLQLLEEDPERGVEFVAPLQEWLGDECPTVAALALRGIARLCGADCLDFGVALRVICKPGKVKFLEPMLLRREVAPDASSVNSDVASALAELCEAGSSSLDDEDSEPDGNELLNNPSSGAKAGGTAEELSPEAFKASEMLLKLASYPAVEVRAAAFKGLAAYVPKLPMAAAVTMAVSVRSGANDAADAPIQVKFTPAEEMQDKVRKAVLKTLAEEADEEVHRALSLALGPILAQECEDPATWNAKQPASGGSQNRHGDGAVSLAATSGPSNRLLAALPSPNAVAAAAAAEPTCAGLAGAAMSAFDGIAAPGAERGSPHKTAKGAAPAQQRFSRRSDEALGLLGVYLGDEDANTSFGGCLWQCLLVSAGVRRAVQTLLGVYKDEAPGAGASAEHFASTSSLSALNTLRESSGSQWRSPALLDLALAYLADVLPASQAETTASIATTMIQTFLNALRNDAEGIEPLLPLCVALASRNLPASHGSLVNDAADAISRHAKRLLREILGENGAVEAQSGTSGAAHFMLAALSSGVLLEWTERHPNHSLSKTLVQDAVQQAMGWIGCAVGAAGASPAAAHEEVPGGEKGTSWAQALLAVPQEALAESAKRIGQSASAPAGGAMLGLALSIGAAARALSTTQQDALLVECLTVMRRHAEAGVIGASATVPMLASVAVRAGLAPPTVLWECVQAASDVCDSPCAPEDALIGAATTISIVYGTSPAATASLPANFAEQLFTQTRRKATGTVSMGGGSGAQAAALVALAALCGNPVLFPPCKGSITGVAPFVKRPMVDTVVRELEAAMKGPSLRIKNAAARTWGLLCATRLAHERHEVGAELEGPAVSLDTKNLTLSLPAENTALCRVLRTLVGCAATGGSPVRTEVLAAPALVCRTILSCLEPLPLRVAHAHMALLVESILTSQPPDDTTSTAAAAGVTAAPACLSFLAKVGARRAEYVAPLQRLLLGPALRNASAAAVQWLAANAADVAAVLPSAVITAALEALWETISGPDTPAFLADPDPEKARVAIAFLASVKRSLATQCAAATKSAAGNGNEAGIAVFVRKLLLPHAHAPKASEALLGGVAVPPDGAGAGVSTLWAALLDCIAQLPTREILREPLLSSGDESTSAAEAAVVFSLVARGVSCTPQLDAALRWVVGPGAAASHAGLLMQAALSAIAAVACGSEFALQWLPNLLVLMQLPTINHASACRLLANAIHLWQPTALGCLLWDTESTVKACDEAVTSEAEVSFWRHVMRWSSPSLLRKIRRSMLESAQHGKRTVTGNGTNGTADTAVLSGLLRLYRHADAVAGDDTNSRALQEVVISALEGCKDEPALHEALLPDFVAVAAAQASREARNAIDACAN